MQRPSTRQGTDYGAQDLAVGGNADDSEIRGPEHRTLRDDPGSESGSQSRSSPRESKSSDSRCSPKGSPVSRKGLRKENIGGEIKREDEGVIDRTSDREYSRFRFLGGLKELACIALTTREAVVAVAKRNTPGPGLDKALLLDMGVPKDSVEKVMQVYLPCYGDILTREDRKDESHY